MIKNLSSKTKPLPEQETLLSLLSYDPETGVLTWKHRPSAMFNEGGNKKREWLASTWNTRFANKRAGTSINSCGYFQMTLGGRLYRVHRIIWKMVYDEEPDLIDHINRNRADNRLCNLRAADHSLNTRNSSLRKDNTTGVTGLVYNRVRKRWIGQITYEGQLYQTGHKPDRNTAESALHDLRLSLGI